MKRLKKTPEWLIQLMNQAIDQGMNQREMAVVMGVTQPNISKYLSGAQAPNINSVSRLLDRLGGDVMRALPGYVSPSIVKESLPVYKLSKVQIKTDSDGTRISLYGENGTLLPLPAKKIDYEIVMTGDAKPPKESGLIGGPSVKPYKRHKAG